jgi:hypothetical protein
MSWAIAGLIFSSLINKENGKQTLSVKSKAMFVAAGPMRTTRVPVAAPPHRRPLRGNREDPHNFLNLDLQGRFSSYLDSASAHIMRQVNQQYRFTVKETGEHKTVFVRAGNIQKILAVLSTPNNNLDRASFEIKVFDSVVQDHFARLCKYARKLKINFRRNHAPPDNDEVGVGVSGRDQDAFTRIAVAALVLLKGAPRLCSLCLDFDTDDRALEVPRGRDVRRMFRCSLGSDEALRALVGVVDAPVLSRLYVNLSNNALVDSHAHILSELYLGQRKLHTLSLNLDHNRIGSGARALAWVGRVSAVTTLHLSLKNNSTANAAVPPFCIGSDLYLLCFGIRHSPSLRKLYLDLTDTGVDRCSVAELATLRLSTLHIGLRSNSISDSEVVRSMLDRMQLSLPDLYCDLEQPSYPRAYGNAPRWSKGSFMDGFPPWNDGGPGTAHSI